MTAVEFLIEQFKIYLPSIHQKGLQDAFQHALELEKEQIMQAYKFNATGEPDGAEHYYEMFYKKYNQ